MVAWALNKEFYFASKNFIAQYVHACLFKRLGYLGLSSLINTSMDPNFTGTMQP